jgi:arsenate reductase (glutaredoxin)
MKKAFDLLKSQEIAYEFVNYKTTKLQKTKIRAWLEKASLEKVLNKVSTTYKALAEAERPQNVDQALAFMQASPSAIKRPLIEYGHKVYVGLAGLQELLAKIKST